jgi:RNA polymerase sigma-70 factor (ECF subfamily)
MGSLAGATAPPISEVLLNEHRVALTGHCYRMLGSAAEADDAVQETLLRAWRGLSGFDGRASLRTWLYRIATNVCLDAIADRKRRQRPVLCREVGCIDEDLTALPADHWIEPIPDLQAVPTDVDPAQQAALRQSIRLAFVAALQHLPPRQRAVLLLADVLDLSASEIADSLAMSVAAVNSALQRARATMASRDISPSQPPPSLSPADELLVSRYVQAFERYDMDALLQLLHDEVTLSMPPYTLWLRGHESVRAWMLGRGAGCRGSRLLPTAACGLPAFGQYRAAVPGPGYQAWSLIVLEYDARGARITALNHFLDTANLFPRFGLPLTLD